MLASVYYCGYTSMTLCEPTVQHFLLLAHSYSHRKGLSVCHNHTSVCSKTSTAPLETNSWDPCKQPAFCWDQFLQNGKLEARSPTPEFSSIHLWKHVDCSGSGTSAVLEFSCSFLSSFSSLFTLEVKKWGQRTNCLLIRQTFLGLLCHLTLCFCYTLL